jgi:hypothetical protein
MKLKKNSLTDKIFKNSPIPAGTGTSIITYIKSREWFDTESVRSLSELDVWDADLISDPNFIAANLAIYIGLITAGSLRELYCRLSDRKCNENDSRETLK